jgi:hypothetical protein
MERTVFTVTTATLRSENGERTRTRRRKTLRVRKKGVGTTVATVGGLRSMGSVHIAKKPDRAHDGTREVERK